MYIHGFSGVWCQFLKYCFNIEMLKFCFEINTFIQQGCNKVIRSDSQVMYNQTNAALLSLLFIREKLMTLMIKKGFLSTKSAY